MGFEPILHSHQSFFYFKLQNAALALCVFSFIFIGWLIVSEHILGKVRIKVPVCGLSVRDMFAYLAISMYMSASASRKAMPSIFGP